jgi:hypothetical protein
MKQFRFNQQMQTIARASARPLLTGLVLGVLAFGFFAGTEARAVDYLARVGPPALRFETVPEHPVVSAAKMLTPEIIKEITTAASKGDATNLPASTPPPSSVATMAVIPDQPANAGKDISVLTPAAGDDSVVTTEMLADFLKPAAGGTVIVPLKKLGFTPPTKPAVEPSRAVYKSQ